MPILGLLRKRSGATTRTSEELEKRMQMPKQNRISAHKQNAVVG
jgi:hypothetical protein